MPKNKLRSISDWPDWLCLLSLLSVLLSARSGIAMACYSSLTVAGARLLLRIILAIVLLSAVLLSEVSISSIVLWEVSIN